MDKLYWLDRIQLQDRTKVGEKAFKLSTIKQLGYPVVPGFVLGAEVMQEFLESLNASEALIADLPHSSLHLDADNWRQLQQVAKNLRQEIINATVSPEWVKNIISATQEWESKYLVFRPSIALPYASDRGLENISSVLETQFCCNEFEGISSALKRVWSQLFRAKSLFYWQRIGVDLQQVNFAVLVQPIESAIASGVLNSYHWGWEIEATYGLGIGITLGDILPDFYSIEGETLNIQKQQLGNKILAYRIGDNQSIENSPAIATSSTVLNNNCLLPYILEEIKQQQYALSPQYLHQLNQIAGQLIDEFGSNFSFNWTIFPETPIGRIYLTKVNNPLSSINRLNKIRGLAASTGKVKATTFIINNSDPRPELLPHGVILIAPNITPDWLPILRNVAGIVAERGGLTSHAAILARELGIPAVVNVPEVTSIFEQGETILIDGDNGEIYRLSADTEKTLDNGKSHQFSLNTKLASNQNQPGNLSTAVAVSMQHNSAANDRNLLLPEDLPRSSSPNLEESIVATQLLVNLSQSHLIEEVKNLAIDGVGLIRSELMVLKILEGQHPRNWLRSGRREQLLESWCQEILQFVGNFNPRPVFYRSLDWRSHELPSLHHHSQSSSQSILGERGTLSYLQNPEIFELELEALANIQQAGYSNVNLILPFVRTVEEFSFCRHKVEEAGLTRTQKFQLWIMAEVPSVLFLLPEYIKAGVQGISIGTNDLTQLLLGVDREQGQLAAIFDERHPVVMTAISKLIQMAKEGEIPCSICGQAPALYPEVIDKLVEWGITSISVEPEALKRTHSAIARAEKRLILEAARTRKN